MRKAYEFLYLVTLFDKGFKVEQYQTEVSW